MKLVENMAWPPRSIERYKQHEHSVWFSGEPELLAEFYSNMDINNVLGIGHNLCNRQSFWARQYKNKSSYYIHVPIAGDIADTAAAFLFGETPIIRFEGLNDISDKDQATLDTMLVESKFFKRILEGAECASAIGGIYFKLCWDKELSPYPIPVVAQADYVIPTFKFGKLWEASFVTEFCESENSESKVYRLFETYSTKGIVYELFFGSDSNIGQQVDLKTRPETKDLQDADTCNKMCAFYVPNLLPNRLNRNSNQGRSDYSGIESLMDSLDETFTCWMIDVQNARARLMLPQSYLTKDVTGNEHFNIDRRMYVELDADPLSLGNDPIKDVQFAIRAEDFEKTVLNLLDRIITSAGYSPQSFGLNIQGRAESGTALNVRERKSYATTAKKESYWETELKDMVTAMCTIYIEKLGGKLTRDLKINIEFGEYVANNTTEVATSIKLLSDAQAVSAETKVAMLHPEWTKKQIADEVEKITSAGSPPMENPDGNNDLSQLDRLKQKLAQGKDETPPEGEEEDPSNIE